MTKYYWHKKESKSLSRLFFKKDDKWYMILPSGIIYSAHKGSWIDTDFSSKAVRPATEKEIENIPALKSELDKYKFYQDLLS